MRDGLRFTYSHTRWWFCTVTGPAGRATILDLLALVMAHKCDGFFAENINFVRTHLEDFGRTDVRALATGIALVRIDDDIPIPRTIAETIIGYQCNLRNRPEVRSWRPNLLASNLKPSI